MFKYEFHVHFKRFRDTEIFRISAINQSEAWRQFFYEVSVYGYLNSALSVELFCVGYEECDEY